MGRRRGGGAEDLVTLVARIPWWAGVLLAIAAYVGLTALATVKGGPAAVLIATFAGVARYVLPMLILAGAALSAWGRHQRRGLLDAASQSDGDAAVRAMSWHQFELLIGEAYRRRGYVVAETGGGGADGGVDLVLTRDGRKTLVQCKHWKVFSVGVSVVRELFGVMAARGAVAGIVITSGTFTQAAREFAAGKRIELVDGPALALMLRSASGSASGSAPTAGAAKAEHGGGPSTGQLPACPVCSKPMIRRIAKQGATAGEAFWGCTGFPACRGTRPLA
jgi:restriction system protein